eukprot:TRINITY_DN927_c0_g1_i2.p1 TRINITY_DN927_c0_g1~~TRINITY_DN927_c0_g1_i2.p1  ORF type:complete len:881 (+),score=136.52 TRINITY_DN927_c0_g1_i2:50-2692(+)
MGNGIGNDEKDEEGQKVERLKTEFPGVQEDHLRQVLASANGNVELAQFILYDIVSSMNDDVIDLNENDVNDSHVVSNHNQSSIVVGNSINNLSVSQGFIPKNWKEEEIIMESSFIMDKVFLPWSLQDLMHEQFYLQNKYKDPDGMLPLTEEQEKKFYCWKRVSEIIEGPVISKYGMSVNCITQSVVGDCSFLCALIVAINYEKIHGVSVISKNIFPQGTDEQPIYNEDGKYAVKMYWNGSPRKILVDDFVPVTKHNSILCSTSNIKNEIWVTLFEKAYMKVRGGYSHGSVSSDDMHLLIGWIPDYYTTKKDSEDYIWNKIYAPYNQRQCMITFSSGELEGKILDSSTPHSSYLSDNGLLSNHCYACLELREVNGTRLVKIKNPWTSQRWRGKYSENDHQRWTPELQEILGYDIEMMKLYDNGIFWMEFTDVCRYFINISVVWNPHFFSKWETIHGKIDQMESRYNVNEKSASTETFKILPHVYVNQPQYTFRVSTTETTQIWFHLIRHIRYMTEPDPICIDIYPSNGKRTNFLADSRIASRKYTVNANLLTVLEVPPGDHEYTLVVCHRFFQDFLNFSLRVHGNSPIFIEELPYPSKIFYQEVDGEFNKGGGYPKFPQFIHSPMYKLSFSDKNTMSSIWIKLEAPWNSHIKLFLVSNNGERQLWDGVDRKLIDHSGKYSEGYAFIETNVNCSNDYTIILSTHTPGMHIPFNLGVNSSHSSFTLESIASIGEGMPFYNTAISNFSKHHDGIFYTVYQILPTEPSVISLHLRRTNESLKNYKEFIKSGNTDALRSHEQSEFHEGFINSLTKAPHLQMELKTPDGRYAIANSGVFIDWESGVTIPNTPIQPTDQGYILIVRSTEMTPFILKLYSTKEIISFEI